MNAAQPEHAQAAASRFRQRFWLLWTLLLAAKFALAATLPLFGDEAFYWWESQHPAWAYSDLPALTAWLIGLGTMVGGDSLLGVRWPFLLVGAACPLLVVRIARRWEGQAIGWRAGTWSMLLPLLAALGVLAVPDAPLTLAGLICFDALSQLQRRIAGSAAAWLALGLVVGALAHYRFVLLIGAGGAWLLLDPRGRELLRAPVLWAALGAGAVAWWPVLQFNLAHSGAGLRFQLIERHPWELQLEGLLQPVLQAMLVTPVLYGLLLGVLFQAWRRRVDEGPWRLVAVTTGVLLGGLWLSALFTDSERVSFHWPLLAYLPLIALLPSCLDRWRLPWLERAAGATAALGMAALLGWMAATASAPGRDLLASRDLLPNNFAGWHAAGVFARARLEQAPPGTVLVADNFMLGAQLAFAFASEREVFVLEHPRNQKHGRALQLELWGRTAEALSLRHPDAPRLLLIEDGALRERERLDWYRTLCRQLGSLGPFATRWADGRSNRFLAALVSPAAAPCVLPALAWIDQPDAGSELAGPVDVRGWAFKDGAGVAEVWITLDDRPLQRAEYDLPAPQVAAFWRVSTDPAHPDVGLHARVRLPTELAGEHVLGLLVVGKDGSREQLSPRPVTIVRPGE